MGTLVYVFFRSAALKIINQAEPISEGDPPLVEEFLRKTKGGPKVFRVSSSVGVFGSPKHIPLNAKEEIFCFGKSFSGLLQKKTTIGRRMFAPEKASDISLARKASFNLGHPKPSKTWFLPAKKPGFLEVKTLKPLFFHGFYRVPLLPVAGFIFAAKAG